jgi:hypothetical protein
LLDDVCFPTVEVFAVSCRNALGDNIDTLSLAGCIFVEGQCLDELIDAAAAALAAKATEEENLAAEVKTHDKQPASPAEDKVNEEREKKFLHFFCELPRLQSVSS